MINKIKIEDSYHPLGSEDFIDITISVNGVFYSGLLEKCDKNDDNKVTS